MTEAGVWTGVVHGVQDTPDGPMLAADHGVFLYDGARVVRLPGSPMRAGQVHRFG